MQAERKVTVSAVDDASEHCACCLGGGIKICEDCVKALSRKWRVQIWIVAFTLGFGAATLVAIGVGRY